MQKRACNSNRCPCCNAQNILYQGQSLMKLNSRCTLCVVLCFSRASMPLLCHSMGCASAEMMSLFNNFYSIGHTVHLYNIRSKDMGSAIDPPTQVTIKCIERVPHSCHKKVNVKLLVHSTNMSFCCQNAIAIHRTLIIMLS